MKVKQESIGFFWLQATEVDSGYLEMKKSLLKRCGQGHVHRIEGKVEKSS